MLTDGSSVSWGEEHGAETILSADDFANSEKNCDEDNLGHSLRIVDTSCRKVAHHGWCKTTISTL